MSSVSTVIEKAPVAASAQVQFSSRRAYAHTFAATVAIRCLGVVSGVLAARLLGPEGRGELAVIMFLPVLLFSVGEIELPRSLACEVSKLPQVPRETVSTGFWLAVGLSTVQAVVLLQALPVVLPPDKQHLIPAAQWFALYPPATITMDSLMGIDLGRGRFGRFSTLLVLPGAVYLGAMLLAWATGMISPQVFAFGMLAGAVATALVRLVLDGDAILRARPDWAIAWRLLARGWSFYLPAMAGLALMRADMFLLVRLVPTEAIGLYAVALAIALGQIGAVNPFVQVGFAAVAAEPEPRRALEILARHFRLAQLALVGIGLLSMALTPWLIRVLFGEKFLGAVPTTYLLIGAMIFWGMAHVLEQGLRAAGHPRPGIVSNLLGLGLLIGLGIPACLQLGIAGLAGSLLAAQFLNLSILVGFCAFRLEMPAQSLWALEAGTLSKLGLSLRSVWQNFYNSSSMQCSCDAGGRTARIWRDRSNTKVHTQS